MNVEVSKISENQHNLRAQRSKKEFNADLPVVRQLRLMMWINVDINN